MLETFCYHDQYLVLLRNIISLDSSGVLLWFFWSFKLKPPVSYLYVGSLSPVPRTWTALSETPVTASIYIILLSLDTHIVQDGVPDTL